MLALLAVWAALWAGSQSAHVPLLRDLDRPDRIVGGEVVSRGEFPWQVSLQQNGGHFCGGTLIAPGWVVTAAHCTKGIDYSRVKAVTGAWDLQELNNEYLVAKVIRGKYDTNTFENDIALLHLDTLNPVRTSKRSGQNATAIAIESRKEVGKGQNCHVSGWGRTSSGGPLPNRLMAAQVEMRTDQQCRHMFNSGTYVIHDSNVCAGGGERDACQGDSGGPLVCCDGNSVAPEDCRLAGITSWGVGCATRGIPGVYTEVAHFNGWIRDVISDEEGAEGVEKLRFFS